MKNGRRRKTAQSGRSADPAWPRTAGHLIGRRPQGTRWPYSRTDTTAAPATPADGGRARSGCTRQSAGPRPGAAPSGRPPGPGRRPDAGRCGGPAGPRIGVEPAVVDEDLPVPRLGVVDATHFFDPYTSAEKQTLAGSCQLTSIRATRPAGEPQRAADHVGHPRLDEALALAVDHVRPLAHEPDRHRDVMRCERPPRRSRRSAACRGWSAQLDPPDLADLAGLDKSARGQEGRVVFRQVLDHQGSAGPGPATRFSSTASVTVRVMSAPRPFHACPPPGPAWRAGVGRDYDGEVEALWVAGSRRRVVETVGRRDVQLELPDLRQKVLVQVAAQAEAPPRQPGQGPEPFCTPPSRPRRARARSWPLPRWCRQSPRSYRHPRGSV